MNTQRPIPLRPDASLLQAAERRSFVRACAAIALGVRTSGRRKAVAAKLRSGALLRGQACRDRSPAMVRKVRSPLSSILPGARPRRSERCPQSPRRAPPRKGDTHQSPPKGSASIFPPRTKSAS